MVDIVRSGPVVVRGEVFDTGPPLVQARRAQVAHDIASHTHDFLEIAVVASGRATHHTVDTTAPLTPGDVVVMRPGMWHGYRACRALVMLNCFVAPDALEQAAPAVLHDPAVNRLLWSTAMPGRRDGIATRLEPEALDRCARHLTALEASHGLAALGHFILLVTELTLQESALRARRSRSRKTSPPLIPLHPAVARCVRRIELDPAHPWTLDALAAIARIDRAYLTRLFTTHLGHPPMAYLARLRLQRAAALLLSSNDPIGQIAYRCGFDDVNYFARRFKARYGQPASAYRQRPRKLSPA